MVTAVQVSQMDPRVGARLKVQALRAAQALKMLKAVSHHKVSLSPETKVVTTALKSLRQTPAKTLRMPSLT